MLQPVSKKHTEPPVHTLGVDVDADPFIQETRTNKFRKNITISLILIMTHRRSITRAFCDPSRTVLVYTIRNQCLIKFCSLRGRTAPGIGILAFESAESHRTRYLALWGGWQPPESESCSLMGWTAPGIGIMFFEGADSHRNRNPALWRGRSPSNRNLGLCGGRNPLIWNMFIVKTLSEGIKPTECESCWNWHKPFKYNIGYHACMPPWQFTDCLPGHHVWSYGMFESARSVGSRRPSSRNPSRGLGQSVPRCGRPDRNTLEYC